MLALLTAFVISYSGLFISFGLSIKNIFVLDSKACVAPRPPPLVGIWASQLAFNLFAFVLAIISVLYRPYRHRIEVVNRLRRDVGMLFVWVTVTYFVGGESGTFYATMACWALDSVALSRLILQFEAVKSKVHAAQPFVGFQDMHEMSSFPHI
ncbi:hypothetical protein EW026_g1671 [Hermanssonia centrifuga]|uniref:Integral membrane protein n=1 Tax=Hermanssonia centrifuga TaxID=98765 RepID=A0A4V3XB76_9APHY|nr:hypothetical protein EW026_g1671 [Hermanssonia centrifuga]